jgi:hypothetical protein
VASMVRPSRCTKPENRQGTQCVQCKPCAAHCAHCAHRKHRLNVLHMRSGASKYGPHGLLVALPGRPGFALRSAANRPAWPLLAGSWARCRQGWVLVQCCPVLVTSNIELLRTHGMAAWLRCTQCTLRRYLLFQSLLVLIYFLCTEECYGADFSWRAF